jgi:hypothetical protein
MSNQLRIFWCYRGCCTTPTMCGTRSACSCRDEISTLAKRGRGSASLRCIAAVALHDALCRQTLGSLNQSLVGSPACLQVQLSTGAIPSVMPGHADYVCER